MFQIIKAGQSSIKSSGQKMKSGGISPTDCISLHSISWSHFKYPNSSFCRNDWSLFWSVVGTERRRPRLPKHY